MTRNTRQLYVTLRAWEPDEWPFDYDHDTFEALNRVAPRGCHYAMCPMRGFNHPVVELQEYVGEFDIDTEEVMLE